MRKQRTGLALLVGLMLVGGCVLDRPPRDWREDVPRPVVVPPRDESNFDVRQLVGMKTEAIRHAERHGLRCTVVGEPARPYPPPNFRRRDDPNRWVVILLEVADGKVTEATLSGELSGGQ
jgi:hypothetical protein